MDLGALADGQGCFPFVPEAYPSGAHSRGPSYGIRSLIGFGSLVRPLAHSVLYLRYLLCKASPIAISRRTSYHAI
jgi:hypothetical protein